MNPLFNDAIGFVCDTVHLFYSGASIGRVVERLADDFSWIGAGEIEFSTDTEEIVSYLTERAPLVPPCEVFDEEFWLVNVTDQTCTVMGRYRVRTGVDSGMVLEEHQRCTYELVDEGGLLKVRHVHVSNPYRAMSDKPYFPFEEGAQNYEYLQQLVHEKTETIDLITEHINGGLKVSEDDERYTISYVNDGLARMFGYTVDEFIEASNGSSVDAVYEPDRAASYAAVQRCFEEGSSFEVEYRVQRKDGSLAWILDSGCKVQLPDGSTKVSSVLMDITSRKEAEEALALERERYRVALRSVTDVLFEYDIENDVLTEFERSAESRDGAAMAERVHERYFEEMMAGLRIHPDDCDRLFEALKSGRPVTIEIRHMFPERYGDELRWVRLHATMISDQAGKPVRTIGSWKDITEERALIEKLEERVRRDPLTKLLNQIAVLEEVAKALPSCLARGTGALFVIDIDDFKAVNDTLGHLTGDELLMGVARSIEEALGGEGLAARVGGDEFLAFMPDVDRSAALSAAMRLAHAVEGMRASDPPVTLSVGTAMVGEDGTTYELLFAAADRALYAAKRKGKDQVRFSGEEL